MHYIHRCILLNILLLTTILITNIIAVEVIEDDGTTTEEQDMAKALALSKRFIWRNFVAKWNCGNIEIGRWQNTLNCATNPEKERHKKLCKTFKELKKICRHWRMFALAADAYAKCWECKQQKMNLPEGSSRPMNPFECVCVKPWFGTDRGELLMSSAMEAIKAVYRDLFGWGKGKYLDIKVEFKNLSTWVTVEYWIQLHKNGTKFAEGEFLQGLLLEVNDALGRDPYLLDNEQIVSKSPKGKNKKQFLKNVSKNTQVGSDTVAPPLTVASIKERLDNGEEQDYVSKLNTFYEQFVQQFNKITTKYLHERNYELCDIKLLHERYKNWWNIVHEIGLDMAVMCKAARFFEKENNERENMTKIVWTAKRLATDLWHWANKKEKKRAASPLRVMEKKLGINLLLYKHKIHDEFVKKHSEELEPVPDPCEEAKLKLKKKP